MVRNGIYVELEETPEQILARCRIDPERLAGLMASLAPDSILLLGVPHSGQSEDHPLALTIRAVPLPNLIHPSRSLVEFTGAELLLTLEKRTENGA